MKNINKTKSNNSKPILKVYFIDNEYLSTCNICLYNIPKKVCKNGFYQYNFNFPKFKLNKTKYDVNVSVSIPKKMLDSFEKYGIMQKNQLSYCEVFNNHNATFSMDIWLYSCETEIIGKKIKVTEDGLFFSASINKYKKHKHNKKSTHKLSEKLSNTSKPLNYVSLSYVPNHKVKGYGNAFRPYQGGSWTPR